VLGLFTRDPQSSFFSFRREGLDLGGLSLTERKFELRESLDGRLSLGRLGRRALSNPLGRRVHKRPKMRG